MKIMILYGQKGFTIIEALVVAVIFAAMVGGGFLVLSTGKSAWFITDTNIELQENLRQAVDKINQELQESGFDKNNVAQYTLNDGTGVNATDMIKFSVPVICHNGDNIMDANSNIAHWGAPLTWGCTTSSCMDADNNCNTVDYQSIQYLVKTGNQLVRRVLSQAGTTVREDILAQDILDFQITLSGNNNIITLTVTAQRKAPNNRMMTASTSVQVYLRNRG